MPRWIGLLAGMFAVVVVSPASAQWTRYELGRRLRTFEQTWDQTPDPQARARAAEKTIPATSQFFAFNLPEAGRTLDLARLALLSAKPASPEVLWAASLSLRPQSHLLDASTRELSYRLEPFYKPRTDQPEKVQLRLTLINDTLSRSLGTVDIDKLPLAGKVPLKDLKPGDYTLRMEILAGKTVLARGTQTLSLVDRLEDRLKTLHAELEKIPSEKRRCADGCTATQLHETLTELARGEFPETDYPASQLLTQAEECVKALRRGESALGQKKPGQFWLTIPDGKSTLPLRMLAPDAVKKGDPLPVVIALHGLGVTENMWFDAYGAGGIVRLCQERGWLLVAPRYAHTEMVNTLLDEVEKLYPIDRKKVFLVGHSMGAGQAIGYLSRHPEKYRAVAALGGGGGLRVSDGIKEAAVFIGVGTEDRLAVAGARALQRTLKNATIRMLAYQEYKGIDHLVVVQVALPEVFAFFDKQLKR